MSVNQSNDLEVCVDGSAFEGGGQILRNAVSLAAICDKNIRVNRIRAGREKPGLGNQHVAGLQLAAKLSDAYLLGCTQNSTEIKFHPKRILNGDFNANSRTAGSIALLAQISVPILAFSASNSTIVLQGGTDARFAPPIDYITEITAHYYKQFGIYFSVDVLERGYFPRGGGRVEINVDPVKSKLNSIDLCDPGSIAKIRGVAFVAGKCPIQVAEEMCSVAKKLFRLHFPECPTDFDYFRAVDSQFNDSVSSFLFIVETSAGCRLAASGIGQPRGPSTQDLVTEAIEQLIKSLHARACCDVHMQDQLILPMALADGLSRIRTTEVTLHTQSAIYVAELIAGVKFSIEELSDGAIILSCIGAGFSPEK